MPTSHKTIGVIGLGSIGMRHAENLLAMGYRVLGYDTDSASMKAFLLPQNGDVGWFVPGADSAVIDGVVIASPSDAHYNHIVQTAESGKPMLVEKPIATSVDDWLRDAIYNSNVMVGNNLRFHSCVKKAKEWLDAGLIGGLLWANFTLAQYNDKYTDDVILNWGSHELDLARYLLGECRVVTAARTGAVADIILHHTNLCQTTVHLDYITRPHTRYFSIYGTEGFVAANLENRQVMLGGAKENKVIDNLSFPDDTWNDDYLEEMQCFIDCIDGIDIKQTEAATGEDGLAVLELCLEAKRLAET